MNTDQLIASIDAEISRLQQARALLNGNDSTGIVIRKRKRKRGVMSAEGRARIAAAQRKRWAQRKKASK